MRKMMDDVIETRVEITFWDERGHTYSLEFDEDGVWIGIESAVTGGCTYGEFKDFGTPGYNDVVYELWGYLYKGIKNGWDRDMKTEEPEHE